MQRLGFIGCGGHAQIGHLKFLDGAAVTAVTDLSPASLEAAFGVIGSRPTVYESAEALVASPDVDAVMIMTPDDTHPDLLELVVNAGKPVLCEKPLATTPEGLAKVNRALNRAERQNLLVSSCHARRDRHNTDLPYGWFKANLRSLTRQFGALNFIGLNSSYTKPGAAWKNDRSFLLDKFTHDIDYLRFLLGDLPFGAQRLMDGYDHYEVMGTIGRTDEPDIRFTCGGSRLHRNGREIREEVTRKCAFGACADYPKGPDEGEFIETITSNFAYGECAVYTKTGAVRLRDRQTGEIWNETITPMTENAYDRVFRNLMRDFVTALNGGPRVQTYNDLRIINEAALALTLPAGKYHYEVR